jgi:aspartate carbamoyltransferase catalytic subunit
MAVNMKEKSLASLHDLTKEIIEQILKTSELLKPESHPGHQADEEEFKD